MPARIPTDAARSPRDTAEVSESETAAAPLPRARPRFDERFAEIMELARGGQGRVVLAQDGILRREVALKVPLRSGTALRRFEREARLTARLQHPGIVSIYDLARRDSGEPVLVMRRVQGKPFDQAIEEAESYAQRLALLAPFTAACDAIAYAHRQGVIHRDIKPSNVLLGEFGDTVVIDWGIAKEIDAEDDPVEAGIAEDSAVLTAAGEVIGTPAFMSPEQARGEAADAKSDVYALGAMLYELLSGSPPYAGKTGQEVLRAVAEGPPPPLGSSVAPELVTIVERAMARDRTDRYATASELAEELKHFQTGRLVASHSYTARERLGRWARRNARLLAVSGVALALIVVGGAVSVRRILTERERANRQAATSRRALEFMTGMFKVADPGANRGNTVTAREILDSAAKDVETKLAEDPEVRARLMRSMGTVYRNLGLYPESGRILEKAARTMAEQLGPDHPDSLEAESELLAALDKEVRLSEAEKVGVDLVERTRRTLGPGGDLTLRAENQLGLIYARQRRFEDAEQVLRQALETARATRGAEDPLTLAILTYLARTVGDSGNSAEAERLLLDLVGTLKRVQGRSASATVFAVNTLGDVYVDEGRLEEAEALFRENLAVMTPVYGRDHPATLLSVGGLGWVLQREKRYAEAEPLLREALAGRLKRLGPDHPFTLGTRSQLGQLLVHTGGLREAEEHLNVALAGLRRLPNPVDVAFAQEGLAMAAAARGEKELALTLLREAFAALPARDRGAAVGDPAFIPLHGDARFAALEAGTKQVTPRE